MNLFIRRREQREPGDFSGRLRALEDYVEYLRQQGEYGFRQTGKRLDALDGGPDGSPEGKE